MKITLTAIPRSVTFKPKTTTTDYPMAECSLICDSGLIVQANLPVTNDVADRIMRQEVKLTVTVEYDWSKQ